MVESALGEELSRYLEENPSDGRRIIEKCLTAARAREAARKARDLVIKKGVLDDSILPGKLADCSERNPADARAVHRRGRLRRRLRQAGPRPPLPGDPAAVRQDPQRREGPPRQDAHPRGDQGDHHRPRRRLRRGVRHRQAPLPPRHHHDRRRRGRLPHPHPPPHLLLPLHARAHRRRPPLHRPAAAVPHPARQGGPLDVHRQGEGRLRSAASRTARRTSSATRVWAR